MEVLGGWRFLMSEVPLYLVQRGHDQLPSQPGRVCCHLSVLYAHSALHVPVVCVCVCVSECVCVLQCVHRIGLLTHVGHAHKRSVLRADSCQP